MACEEEPYDHHHETLGRQTKQSNQLSLPHQDDCTTSQTCVKRPLKNRQSKILITTGSLTKVESNAECAPKSILQYFDLH